MNRRTIEGTAGAWVDALARKVEQTTDRRAALRLLAASLAAATPLGAARAAAAEGAAAEGSSRCAKFGKRCSSQVQNYCARTYGGVFQRACARDTLACCRLAANCKTAAATRCLRNSGW
jgi:hypothetical protein